MPSMMIHLAAARFVKPDADGLFLFGSMAPDYIDAREFKDLIHLRSAPDRWAALAELRGRTDFANKPFDEGWLLHLFTDALWDAEVIPDFAEKHADVNEHWFMAYRRELGKVSFDIYHNAPWTKEVWEKIDAAPLDDMRELRTALPVPLELAWYRDRVRRKHRARAGEFSEAFPADAALKFAESAAQRYIEWVKT